MKRGAQGNTASVSEAFFMAWLSHLMLAIEPAVQLYFTSHCGAVVIIQEDYEGKTAPE